MPWHIEPRDNEYCVIKDSDGSTVKCHPTKAEAEAHMGALYANEPSANRMQFVVNQAAKGERITHSGREYLKVPVVAIKAGVLNGELVPAEEIGRHVDSWAGRPVPIGHAYDDNGHPVTVNTPDRFAQSPAQFWNPRFEDGSLKGEIWIDILKAKTLGGDALTAMQRLEAGQMMEVSTGYFRDIQPEAGEHNGKAYSLIARNLRPDHLAILLNETGACSIADGCGAMRVNQEGPRTGVMIALFVPPDVAQTLIVESLPEGSEPTPTGEMHVTLAYLGEIDALPVDEAQMLKLVMSIAERSPVIRAEIGGIGIFNKSTDEGVSALWAQVDSDLLMEWRNDLAEELRYYEVPVSREHGYTPHITLAYVPTGEPVTIAAPARQEIVFDSVVLAWGDKRTAFSLQGEAMPKESEVMANEDKSQDTQEKPVTNEDAGKEKGKAADPKKTDQPNADALKVNTGATVTTDLEPVIDAKELVTLRSKVEQFESFFSEMGGLEKVRETLRLADANAQAMAANARREKERLISALVANERCAFSEEDLAAFEIAQLEKLAQTLRPTDYSGRGMATNRGGADDVIVGEMPMPEFVVKEQ